MFAKAAFKFQLQSLRKVQFKIKYKDQKIITRTRVRGQEI